MSSGFEKKKNKKKNKKGKSSPKSTSDTTNSTSTDPLYDDSGLLATETSTSSSVILGDDTTDVSISMDGAILVEWDRDYEDLKKQILNDRSNGIGRNNDVKTSINELKTKAKEMKDNHLVDQLEAELRCQNIEKIAEIEKNQGMKAYYERPKEVKKKKAQDDDKLSSSDTRYILQEQDEFLGRISSDVTGLKNHGSNIRSEMEMQVALLDGMDQDMDAVNKNIENETMHAKRVNANSSVCSLYITLFILFIIMVLLLIVGLR